MSPWYLEPRGGFFYFFFLPHAAGKSNECLCQDTEPDIAHTVLFRMACLWFQPLLSDTQLGVTQWRQCKTFWSGRRQFMQGFCSLNRQRERGKRQGGGEGQFDIQFPWCILGDMISGNPKLSINIHRTRSPLSDRRVVKGKCEGHCMIDSCHRSIPTLPRSTTHTTTSS